MTLRLISMPDPMPILPVDVREQARVDNADEDALIAAYIASAVEQVERAAHVGFVGATWEWTARTFPAYAIETGFGPITSVVSLTYADPDGADQVVPAEDYLADAISPSGSVFPATTWPLASDRANSIRLRFTSGDGTLPGPIRAAILLTATSAYDDRMDGGELSGAAQRLVGQYRRVWF